MRGLALILLLVLTASCSKTDSGLYSKSSYCLTANCAEPVAGQSLRLNSNPSVIINDYMKSLQISGVCNQGDAKYNQINVEIAYSGTATPPTTPASGAVYTQASTTCDSGRFFVNVIRPCNAAWSGYLTFTLTVGMLYGDVSPPTTVGPRYSTNLTIQYPLAITSLCP